MGFMIPYFPQPEYHLFGPVTVHAFGAIVALSVIVGWKMAVARSRKNGLDPELFQDLLSYVVLSGFVVAPLLPGGRPVGGTSAPRGAGEDGVP